MARGRAVIAVAVVILIAAYLLRDVNTQQVLHAVGASGAPNR